MNCWDHNTHAQFRLRRFLTLQEMLFLNFSLQIKLSALVSRTVPIYLGGLQICFCAPSTTGDATVPAS